MTSTVRLATLLYDAAAPMWPSRGWRRWILLVGLWIAGIVLLVTRVPVSSWNTPYAEDGSIFIQGAFSGDPWVLFQPYAGNLHIATRIIAWLASLAPLDVVPFVMMMLVAAATSGAGVALFLFLEQRLRSIPLRFLGWLAFITMPLAGAELALSGATLEWQIVIVAVWAVLADGNRRPVRVAQIVVVMVACFGGALGALLAVVVVARLLVRRTRGDWVFAGAAVVAALIQLAGIIYAATVLDTPHKVTRPGVGSFIDFFGTHIALPSLTGFHLSEKLGEHLPTTIGGIALIVVVSGGVLGVLRGRTSARFGVIGLAVAALGYALIGALAAWPGLSTLAPFDFVSTGRHAVIPAALITGMLLLVLDSLSGDRGLRRWAPLVLALLMVGMPAVVDHRTVDLRAGAPTWPSAVKAAQGECSTSSTFVPHTAPERFSPGLPCSALPGR